MTTERPNRQSTRLKGFDYAGPGTYFVTICTTDRLYLFGIVVNGEMILSPYGKIAAREWDVSVGMRREIIPHAFVVMPNHVHGLVSIVPETTTLSFDSDRPIARLRPRSLGAFVNGYTGAVTTAIGILRRRPKYVVWQRNYYNHIVRDEPDFESILARIGDNPARWEEDRFNKRNL